jgi:hypothetical protein
VERGGTDTDLEEIRRRRRDRNRLGLRQWIVVFLTVCAGDQAGVAAHAWIIPVVGALISFLRVPAGLSGTGGRARLAATESGQKARVIVDDDREGSFTFIRSNRPTFPFCLL